MLIELIQALAFTLAWLISILALIDYINYRTRNNKLNQRLLKAEIDRIDIRISYLEWAEKEIRIKGDKHSKSRRR